MNPAYRDPRIAALVREYGYDRVLEELQDIMQREGRWDEVEHADDYGAGWFDGISFERKRLSQLAMPEAAE